MRIATKILGCYIFKIMIINRFESHRQEQPEGRWRMGNGSRAVKNVGVRKLGLECWGWGWENGKGIEVIQEAKDCSLCCLI